MNLSLLNTAIKHYSERFWCLPSAAIYDVAVDALLNCKVFGMPDKYYMTVIYHAICEYREKLDREQCAKSGKVPFCVIKRREQMRKWVNNNRERFNQLQKNFYYKHKGDPNNYYNRNKKLIAYKRKLHRMKKKEEILERNYYYLPAGDL